MTELVSNQKWKISENLVHKTNHYSAVVYTLLLSQNAYPGINLWVRGAVLNML